MPVNALDCVLQGADCSVDISVIGANTRLGLEANQCAATGKCVYKG